MVRGAHDSGSALDCGVHDRPSVDLHVLEQWVGHFGVFGHCPSDGGRIRNADEAVLHGELVLDIGGSAGHS